jgi:Xaa-Pro dipeptidase
LLRLPLIAGRLRTVDRLPSRAQAMNKLLNSERASQAMAEHQIDLLIGATPENAFYVTGFQSLMQWSMRGKKYFPTAGCIDHRGRTILVAPAIDLDRAVCDPPPVDEVVPYSTVTIERGDPAHWLPEDEQLAQLLLDTDHHATFEEALESGFPRRAMTIGVDDPDLWAGVADSGNTIVDARPVFEEIRVVKTDEEVRRLTRATEITEQALAVSMAAATEGVEEYELGKLFDEELVRAGGKPNQTIIGFSSFAGYPCHIPGSRRLRTGDLVRWDVGCEYQGYVSDIARVGVCGQSSTHQQQRFDAILAGQLAAIEVARPGVPARAVFEAGIGATKAAGLREIRRKHVGHGIGIDVYEPPMLTADEDLVLEPGMVMEVELVYYELGFGALQIEDTVHITETGREIFTRLPQVLMQLGS